MDNKQIISHIKELFKTTCVDIPADDELLQSRKNSLQQLIAKGLPSKRDESWRFTHLDSIHFENLRLPLSEIDYDPINKPQFVKYKQSLIFIDGHYIEELSTISTPGITVNSQFPSVKNTQNQNVFQSLNTVLLTSSVHIQIASDLILEDPIKIIYFSTTSEAQIQCVRIDIELGSNSTVTFIEKYSAQEKTVSFSNALINLKLGSQARVKYYQYTDENFGDNVLSQIKVQTAENSAVEYGALIVGGDFVRFEIEVELSSPHCSLKAAILNISDDQQYHDIHFNIDHQLHSCESDVIVRNILGGRSKAVTDIKTRVCCGAGKTKAEQMINSMLLSNAATVNAMPRLEIYTDDVLCTHGVTVGDLDETVLFYLQSRGLSKDKARSILLKAFATVVLDKISCGVMKEVMGNMCPHSIATILGEYHG